MSIYTKTISKNLIDKNNHLNIAGYLKLIDESNNILLKKFIKKKFHFVAKKILMENNKEILFKEICKIESFLIKISEFSIISRHEIKCNNNTLRAKCFMEQIHIHNNSKKIHTIEKKNMTILKKLLKKNYKSPFKL